MIYRKYESQDISAIRDILENDLGYNCELAMLCETERRDERC